MVDHVKDLKYGDKVLVNFNDGIWKENTIGGLDSSDESAYLAESEMWVYQHDVGIFIKFIGITNSINIDKHNHYFKNCPYNKIDVYRVLELFNVTDPCIQHAVKKLLVAGGRGHKDLKKDIQDSIDTLERWKTMRDEESKNKVETE